MNDKNVKINIQFVLNLVDKSAFLPDKYFEIVFLKYSKGKVELRTGLFKKQPSKEVVFQRLKKKNLLLLVEQGKSKPINIKIFFIQKFNGYLVEHRYISLQ
jgi:hypothetical protein